jgi:hypothetical protein
VYHHHSDQDLEHSPELHILMPAVRGMDKIIAVIIPSQQVRVLFTSSHSDSKI